MDQTIAEIERRDREKVVLALRRYQGVQFIDLRQYFQNDDDQWCPTKKGVTFSVDQIGELKEAVDKLVAALEPFGGIKSDPIPKPGGKQLKQRDHGGLLS